MAVAGGMPLECDSSGQKRLPLQHNKTLRKGRLRRKCKPVRKIFKQQTITEHFKPARQSTRVNALKSKEEEKSQQLRRLVNKIEAGLRITNEEEKGLGVRTTRIFVKGELVCEYAGDLIDKAEGMARDTAYSADPTIGCYMYFFKHKGRAWCVDATFNNGHGRLINHGAKDANLATKILEVNGKPRLCFFAARDIQPNEELLYDYGDRRRIALNHHPWLAS